MIQLQVLNKILATGDTSILLLNNLNDDFFSDYREEYKWIKLSLTESAVHQNTANIFKFQFNKKYLSFNGYFEIVYSYDNKLLNEGVADIDMGTYNYASHKSKRGGIPKHILYDMFTYGGLKNTENEFWENINR